MSNILKQGLTLALIGFISALALSLTQQLTEKSIEAQQELQLKNLLKGIIPEADRFDEKPAYYEAYKDNSLVGKVLKVDSQGYSSVIQLLVGLDAENKIIAVNVLSQAETPGLGANIEKQDFLSQFKGKDASALNLKKDNGDIDAITGATISSRAVVKGIRESFNSINSIKEDKDETAAVASPGIIGTGNETEDE